MCSRTERGISARGDDAGRAPSVADLVLTGHRDNAEFALGTCAVEPLVASGGKDTQVLLWNLRDSGLLGHTGSNSGASGAAAGQSATLEARVRLEGHDDTVNDVSFVPDSAVELVSVSDDSSLLFWDTRAGTAPVTRVGLAHGKTDVHCCDWSPLRTHLLATGAADGGVRVWDRRRLQSAALTLTHHNGAVTNVEWSPHRAGVFASGDDDGLLCVWNVDARPHDPEAPGAANEPK